MEEGNGNRIRFRGEEGSEVDIVTITVIVLDRRLEVGQRIDAILLLSPIMELMKSMCAVERSIPAEALLPMLLRIYHPLVAHPKLSIVLNVLKRFFCDRTQLQQGLEVM